MGTLSFDAAGTYYFKKGIDSICEKHKDYALSDANFIDRRNNRPRVYEFYIKDAFPVLVSEPDNPKDAKAIAIYIDGVKIGYVPADLCTAVHTIMRGSYSTTASITGGPWKQALNSRIQRGETNRVIHISIESDLIARDIHRISNQTGGRSMQNYTTNTSDKSKSTALLLCIFLGYFGIHYFYVGRIGMGILFLCTFGLFGIGWIVDIIRIAVGSFRDNVGAPLRK